MTAHPAIEQAIKALEFYADISSYEGLTLGVAPMCDDRGRKAHNALMTLRALTEPVAVSKTDEELARELVKDIANCGGVVDGKVGLRQDLVSEVIAHAFTAIRAQARSEAIAVCEDNLIPDFNSKIGERINYNDGVHDCISAIRKLKATK